MIVLLTRFVKAEIPTRAAALAYHSILAIVPIVGLLLWYLTKMGITKRWLDLTREFIISQLNVDSEGRFERYFHKLTDSVQGQGWGWIGLGVLIYTAWNLMAQFGRSLDVILHVNSEAGTEVDLVKLRPHRFSCWLETRRFFVMLTLPVALTLSLAVSHWIRTDSWLRYLFRYREVGPILALMIAWAIDIAVLFLVYYAIPMKRPSWVQAFKAAIVVGPLLEFTRLVFGNYNSYAVSMHKIYGVLAIIPLFILWVQISWTFLLSGALLIEPSSRN